MHIVQRIKPISSYAAKERINYSYQADSLSKNRYTRLAETIQTKKLDMPL
jgi:hypothetical protein